MKKIRNLLWILIGGVFGVCANVFAQDTSGSGPISLPNPLGGNCNDATCVVTKIINFISVLAVPICAIMVLWGGFTLMTSSGDPEKVKTGQNTILYAAVGFVVVLLANSVTTLIQSIFK